MKLIVLITAFSFAVFAENQNERYLEATPDLIELLVDIDPKAYGYRARAHDMAVILSTDPFINGRFSLDYQLVLNNHFKLLIPVSFEHSILAATPIQANPRVKNQWAVLGGLGVKLRLSEWMAKSSFYLELWAQTGLYAQEAIGFGDTRYAIRIRPSLYVGWERVFETGLVIGLKTGVEYNWDIITGSQLAFAENKFNFVPAINTGFAW
ncbi:MAG: hypothetical protein WCK49_01285 [Myxococcaceae bacterium]